MKRIIVRAFGLGPFRSRRNATRYELLVAEGGPKLKAAGDAAPDQTTAPDAVRMRDMPVGKTATPSEPPGGLAT